MGHTSKNSIMFRDMVMCAGEDSGGHPQIIYSIKDFCPVCYKLSKIKELRGYVKEMFRIRDDLKNGRITLEELSDRLTKYDNKERLYI